MLTHDHGGSRKQVWLTARGGDGRSCPSPDWLRSTSVESAGQGYWGDPARTDIKNRLDETRGNKPDTHAPPGDAFLTGLAQVALGNSSLDGSTGREIWVDSA